MSSRNEITVRDTFGEYWERIFMLLKAAYPANADRLDAAIKDVVNAQTRNH